MAQFSSSILPFDDNPNKYTGNTPQSGREASSAKFVPYALLGTTEEMQGEYPVLNRLWYERSKVGFDEALFKYRLEEAFKQFLHFVLTGSKKAVDVRRLDDLQMRIKTVAMTIPSQWDLDFQDLYERLLKKSFADVFEDMAQADARDVDVVFHTEATALAQYIFHQCASAKALALRGGMPEIETILGKTNAQCLIDCGGHNAVGKMSSSQILHNRH